MKHPLITLIAIAACLWPMTVFAMDLPEPPVSVSLLAPDSLPVPLFASLEASDTRDASADRVLSNIPVVSVVDLWSESPEPQKFDAFAPYARLNELWSANPLPYALAEDAAVADPIVLVPAFSLAQASDASTDATTAASDEGGWEEEGELVEEEVPEEVLTGLLNNQHYRESTRLKKLSEAAFEYGDYDAATTYAQSATAAAKRSDEYIALRLKMRAADNALAQAKERLDWAESVDAETRYADQYAAAKSDYTAGVAARKAEELDEAIALARKVLSQLASVREAPPVVVVPVVEEPVVKEPVVEEPVVEEPVIEKPIIVPVVVPVVEAPKPITYPASYKVRPWAETRDCFWNIAGYPWVYNDPTKWPVLYEANKTKLKRPNDPNLLNIGIVLTIPSLRGEIREGIWEKGRSYSPLAKRK